MKMLKIEWMKLRNYRTFQVLSILFFICLIGINFNPPIGNMHVSSTQGSNAISMLIGNPFSFPEVWQNATFWSGFVLFIPGLLMLISVTNEYNFKTHRQNVIDGISRFDFAFGKILWAVIFSVITVLSVAVITVCVGFTKGDTSFSFDKSINLFYFFLQSLSYILTGALFGFLLKRAGLAVSLYLIYVFMLKYILSGIFNKIHSGVGDIFPLRSADNLIPLELWQRVGSSFFSEPNMPLLIGMTIVYIVVFYFIIIKKFQKEDL